MKDYEIKRKSWHYKLIDNSTYFVPADGCGYCRLVAKLVLSKAIEFLFLSLLVIIVCACLGSFVGWASASIVNLTFIPLLPWREHATFFDFGTMVILFCLISILIAFIMYCGSNALSKLKSKEESLVSQYFRARKEKWCPNITIVD